MFKLLLIVLGIYAITFILSLLFSIGEYKTFNKGVCKNCGGPLVCFDMDSQGGRGYICKNCRFTTWVSYPWVDRKYGKSEDDYYNEKH